MRFDVISLFPDVVHQTAAMGVIGRAIEKKRIQLETWNPRSYTEDVHRTVDDRPFGGGPGMVMKVEPLKKAILAAKKASSEPSLVIAMTPQGRQLNQKGVEYLSRQKRLILVAGRYEGIDERVLDTHVDEEWSIGDYVLSGGELPALVLIDAVSRMLPDVLGHEASAVEDSFVAGLLDHPHYTRPEVVDGQAVPKVLMSGNHKKIALWREKQALGKTWLKRPDLLEKLDLSPQQQALLDEFESEHNS